MAAEAAMPVGWVGLVSPFPGNSDHRKINAVYWPVLVKLCDGSGNGRCSGLDTKEPAGSKSGGLGKFVL
jgi:hypothetical protein